VRQLVQVNIVNRVVYQIKTQFRLIATKLISIMQIRTVFLVIVALPLLSSAVVAADEDPCSTNRRFKQMFTKRVVSKLAARFLQVYGRFIKRPLQKNTNKIKKKGHLKYVAPYGINTGLTDFSEKNECYTGPDAFHWLKDGTAERTCLTIDGLERCWFTFIPSSASGKTNMPLMIHLHGAGGCAAYPSMGWGNVAEDHGFVLVWPQGTLHKLPFGPEQIVPNLNCWSDGTGIFGADGAGIDDMKFLNEMMGELSKLEFINKKRVYMSGHSNGAVMAQRFSMQTAGILAGVVAIGANVWPEDTHPDAEKWSNVKLSKEYNPTPIIFISGRNDMTNPFCKQRNPLSPANVSLAGWADVNKCTLDNIQNEKDGWTKHMYIGCENGATVAMIDVHDAGHHPVTKGRGNFQMSPGNVIATCAFRSKPPLPHEPDCQLINIDTTLIAWDFISQFELTVAA